VNISVSRKIETWGNFPDACHANTLRRLWRTHSDAVNGALLEKWWPEERLERSLKTDLFDEAVNEGLIPCLTSRTKRTFCIDTSFRIHQMAKSRYPALKTILTDVRQLPFKNDVFDHIISNSTLDHFESLDDLSVALKGLFRVLRPGGQMILTLDNPENPVVLLRNGLPYPLLKRLKIIPYYVGATLRRHRLKILLENIGFQILEMDAILHCPRILAVIMTHWMEDHASPGMQRKFLRLLMTFEKLSRWPTRFLTGYFIAVKAIKS
jgi:SAM-dependent methyltransferase